MRRLRETKPKIKVINETSSSSSDTQTDAENSPAGTLYAHQEHARPRARVEHIYSPSTSGSSTLSQKPSLTSSITRFRSDFNELKCKMTIFGESLNLCHCIANDFKIKLSNIERRLELLERRQVVWRHQSNYSAIIQKNKKLSDKTLEDAKKLQMCKTEDEKRLVAARICSNYLHGAWKIVDPKYLVFRRISGGLSNFIYYIGLPENLHQLWSQGAQNSSNTEPGGENITIGHTSFTAVDEPKSVLLRIYGQVHGDHAIDTIVTESVIFTLLSERRLGPKLYGVFNGGRIEEYIPARSLLVKELGDTALSIKIAEKMAAIHSMNVPLSKEPTWLWKNLSKWLKSVKVDRLSGAYQAKNHEEKRIIKAIKDVNFEEEVVWLKNYLSSFISPVVFCHNDLQEGNILILEDMPVLIHASTDDEGVLSGNESTKYEQAIDNSTKDLPSKADICDSVLSDLSESEEPSLFLIDFEYCAYNYRGFDIANHFQEWIFDYTNPDYPFFYVMEEYTPTAHQINLFIKHYLKHYADNNSDESNPQPPTSDAIDRVREEVDAFALMSNLFWSLWAFVNATTSQIPFGYWEYGFTRYDFYTKLKVEAMNKVNSRKKSLSVDK